MARPKAPPTPARKPTRAERVVGAVLEATLSELGRVGFAVLTVEDVANKAGVNKTTVYRRWPTKGALVQAAFERFGGVPPVVNTGSLRDDLRMLIHFKLELGRTNRGKALMRGLLAEALSPELLEISRRLRVQDVALYSSILANARARGELRKGIDDEMIMGALEGPFTRRFLLDGRLPTDADANRVIDLVLNGALK